MKYKDGDYIYWISEDCIFKFGEFELLYSESKNHRIGMKLVDEKYEYETNQNYRLATEEEIKLIKYQELPIFN